MATSLNRVQLIGMIGRPPEVRTTQTGNRVATLSVATSETWKDKHSGERKERTEWHKLTCFNDFLIDYIEQNVTKGARVYVEGSLTTRKWTDRAGNTKYSTEIMLAALAGTLIVLSGRRGAGNAPDFDQDAARSASRPATSGPSWDTPVPEGDLGDEIPF